MSKCRPAISEDETLMEDSSIISKNNNTLQRNQLPNSYKVATILRNRSSSYKDREILRKSIKLSFLININKFNLTLNSTEYELQLILIFHINN